LLKPRLIPCIICKGDLVVQSYSFSRYLPIGNVKTCLEFFVNWDVDEIILIDIDATREKRAPNYKLIEWAATECFVPLTVGGGIHSLNDIEKLLKSGADKICINSAAHRNPNFITEARNKFGTQCITVSIDAKLIGRDHYVYDYLQKQVLKENVIDWAKKAESAGAGEIFLNSVDRDGARTGYDLELLQAISSQLKIPVIACGGVGVILHLSEGITKGGCQAVAAANIFQHTEHSTIAAKAHLLTQGVQVRLSSDVTYENVNFDNKGRPL